MSNPSDTVADLHSELTSALRAIENAEDTFKAVVEAVQTAISDAKDLPIFQKDPAGYITKASQNRSLIPKGG
jgi:hypothetical protein